MAVKKKKKKVNKDNQVIDIKDANSKLLDKISIKNKNNKYKRYITLIILLFIFTILIYIFIPKIYLVGDREITLSYRDEYKEDGYNGFFLFKDITDEIRIDNNINNHVIGKYEVIYYLDYKIIKIKKKRIINIVDKIDPDIKIDSDILMICPNSREIPDINYQAFDEYDGDITDKVNKEILKDKIILSVNDSSNNNIYKEIKIDKNDIDKPVISLEGNDTVYLFNGNSYNEPGYKAIDNCDGDITDKVVVTNDIGNSAGTYQVKYTVTDSNNNTAEVIRKVIIRNRNLYNNGTIENGSVFLTFDDGPNEGTTNVILDILKEEGVKATFFVTCNGPDYLIKRIYDEGHTVALHTCSHSYSNVYSSIDNYFNDLYRVSNRVKNITGIDSKIIRFPGGSSNTISRNYSYGIMSTLTSMVLDRGYRYYDWNVDSNDAGGARSSSEVYYNVINSLRYDRGNMVLMHDVKSTTRDALRDIIHYIKNNGFTFKQIDDNTYMIRHNVNN